MNLVPFEKYFFFMPFGKNQKCRLRRNHLKVSIFSLKHLLVFSGSENASFDHPH